MGLTKVNFYKKPEVELETSWDDGGKLDRRIVDLLNKYKLKGTFYVVLDFIGKEGYMDWNDIKELDQEGFDIGSHTVSHSMDLKMCHDEQLHLEIQNSKDMLETALGHVITRFAYPRGRTDERVKDKVKEVGYLDARGTGKPGILTKEDLFYLPGTIHIFQRPEYGEKDIVTFAHEVLDNLFKNGGYCNIWGHSREIDANNLWDVLEEVLKYAANQRDQKI